MLEEIEGLISHLARGCPPKQTLWTRNRGESWMCFHCARHFRYARETSHAHGLEISDAASQSDHLAAQFGIESRSSLSHSHSGTKLLAFQTEPCEILKLRWAVAGSGTAQLLLTKN